jgi:hypothetical protein
LIFFRGLTHLRHVSFSEGTHILLAGAVIVNDGRKIIRQRRWSGCVNARKKIRLDEIGLFFFPLHRHALDAAVGNEPQEGDEHIQAARNSRTHECERKGNEMRTGAGAGDAMVGQKIYPNNPCHFPERCDSCRVC